jgi:hypothetical protein
MRRLARRRLSLILGILALAGVAVVVAVTWANSSKGPSAAVLAEAREQADARNAEYPDFQDCVDDPDYFSAGEYYSWAMEDPEYYELTHVERCEAFVGFSPKGFIYTYTFSFADQGPLILMGIMIAAGLIMMMLASSAIGAEWSSGGMASLLVWHPNRMKVWGAKLGAALTMCAVAVVVLAALGFGLLLPTAAARGEIGDLDGQWWAATLECLLRTGGLALGMTALGASLAMIGRNTAIAGGVLAGYLIVGDMTVRMLSLSMPMAFPDRLSLYTWAGAWITGRSELYDWTGPAAGSTPDVMVITWGDAGSLLGSIVLGFAVLAAWTFRRRDAT